MALVQKGKKAEKLAQYGARVWNIPESDSEKMADEAINATVEFFLNWWALKPDFLS